jgi:hypothetical protein
VSGERSIVKAFGDEIVNFMIAIRNAAMLRAVVLPSVSRRMPFDLRYVQVA